MRPALDDALTHGTPDYARLPLAVRQFYSLREWLALPDSLKAGLVAAETEPDIFEDGV